MDEGGADFDGCLLFDECHKAKNLSKGTKVGLAVAEILSNYAKKYKLKGLSAERLAPFAVDVFHPAQVAVARYPDFILESDWVAIVQDHQRKVSAAAAAGRRPSHASSGGSGLQGLLSPDTLPPAPPFVPRGDEDDEAQRPHFLKPPPPRAALPRPALQPPQGASGDVLMVLPSSQHQHQHQRQRHKQRQQGGGSHAR